MIKQLYTLISGVFTYARTDCIKAEQAADETQRGTFRRNKRQNSRESAIGGFKCASNLNVIARTQCCKQRGDAIKQTYWGCF